MFRNQYDSDVTVWSPQGRIHQIEYAMEAVKQGSATVGLKSDTCAVLVALKRASNELCSHQNKIFQIDDHMGISIAGLMSDGQLLKKFMQSEALDWRWLHNGPIPLSTLMNVLETKMQINTQRYGRRPFGVGMLVAGWDDNGTHIIQTCPSANTYDCYAMAIGARSQSARTYLEKHNQDFAKCDEKASVNHALRALKDTLPNDMSLTVKNTAIITIPLGGKYKLYEEDDVSQALRGLN